MPDPITESEKTYFVCGFLLGMIVCAVLCFIFRIIGNGEYALLQRQAVKEGAAIWVPDEWGNTTLKFIPNKDKPAEAAPK